MKYDLQIVIPVSSKYYERIQDFKKYGLCNIKERKVLLEVLTYKEKIDGLEDGWPSGVDVKVLNGDRGNDFICNLLSHFVDIDVHGRWIAKIDDDSCTDVDGLVGKLDKFYDHEQKYYLGSLERFVMGKENELAELYRKFFGDAFLNFKHEIEFCVISSGAMNSLIKSESSKEFLHERCKLQGGATDVALAYAAILDKTHPIDFPFATQFPKISEFSMFGGHLNHIHMISRQRIGENFQEWDRCGEIQYHALTRSIDGYADEDESERKLINKRFLSETSREIKIYEFREDNTVKIKFDERVYVWTVFEGKVFIFCDPREICLCLHESGEGKLSGKNQNGEEITLNWIQG